jgi:hypothetical protein
MEQRNNRNRNQDNRGKNRGNRQERPQRKRRVTVDRDVEVVVISNVLTKFFYENPRMNMVIDLENIGDEEYLTVGDIRTILNSNRKILEGFQLVITEVLDDSYTLEDVLTFLGLDKKYDEYYSLARKPKGSRIEVTDIKNFLEKSSVDAFEKTMKSIDEKLRSRVIETAVVLFKKKEFGDFNKMRVIEEYVSDELFADAQETEVNDDIHI